APAVVESVRLGAGTAKVISLTHPSARDRHNWGRSERGAYMLDVVAVEAAVGEACSHRDESEFEPSAVTILELLLDRACDGILSECEICGNSGPLADTAESLARSEITGFAGPPRITRSRFL